jgi:hypothetical protein
MYYQSHGLSFVVIICGNGNYDFLIAVAAAAITLFVNCVVNLL